MNSASDIVRLENISKSFGGHGVVHNLDLMIKDGEFVTLLGPSGCGKTTLLRIIAGLETQDSGKVFIGGKDVSTIPPNKREVNTVFQSYALFPHMSVYDNVAFGLKMEKTPKNEINERVMAALETVMLTGFASRMPQNLSGGQQQRVAIARAIVKRPKVLLLDEPLSALDYKLRKQMQTELKHIQRKLGITFIFVTHDQEEALSMSDRVVVMNEGVIQQDATPKEVYENPKNMFVAKFVGEINVLQATIEKTEAGKLRANVEGRQCSLTRKHSFVEGDKVKLLLRPEDIRLEHIKDADSDYPLQGIIEETTYKGATLDSIVRLDSGTQIMASEFFDEDDPEFEYKSGEKVAVKWVDGWEVLLPDD
ncbi:spermidine/putrescine ABC transporter ATP-binding protein PotA [Seleniivibrio woodruffii]|uniref:spermidine/putrescine ABC transporter ATP-binding protein PotA n=1 Tax=Seleniivibrio woodruffii TaxID=1078050 RepID=UPI002409F91F|nr:spermidine/putrescine ABC transporter ATP-binding protein PotA [Seleniivibrio woodruffii]